MEKINYEPNDYILFIGQEANFQSRSMLVPAKEFIECRKDDYKLLKKSVNSNYTFLINGTKHQIHNLLLQNIIFEGNFGRCEKTEYSELCGILTQYADGMGDNHYFELVDKEWYDKTIINVCSGFNHIQNYIKCKNMTHYKKKPINIVDSFLCIELRNGILELPTCNTVKEMFENIINK